MSKNTCTEYTKLRILKARPATAERKFIKGEEEKGYITYNTEIRNSFELVDEPIEVPSESN